MKRYVKINITKTSEFKEGNKLEQNSWTKEVKMIPEISSKIHSISLAMVVLDLSCRSRPSVPIRGNLDSLMFSL